MNGGRRDMRRRNMRGKKVRITSWLLLIAVLAVQICGDGVTAYAVQSDAAQETAVKDGQATATDKARQVTAADGMETGETDERKEAEQAFAELLKEYAMYGMVTNSAEIAVYQEPALSAPVVRKLPSGYQVQFLAAVIGEQQLWYQVKFAVNGGEYTGYVPDSFLVTQDGRLAEWKGQYFARKARGITYAAAQGGTDLSAFPSSYRSYIRKLINAHPNWTFVPMNTGLKWSEVIENEMVDARNLVDINAPATWKSTASKDYNMSTGKWVVKNGTTWVQASESIVKYYMDPRNMLNEESVFQFEQLTYNGSYHTESGVEKILSGTFMSKKKLEDGSGGNITYARAFMKIGQELGVSPYFLASRVRQEQGVKGDSKLISGTYPGYKGYYNYFNIQATGIGEQVIVSGLQEAKKAGWTTRYAALRGGAQKTASNYISKGQDTFYLQKFDVDNSYDGLYWHQYMQNLLAAKNESTNVRNSYTSMGVLNNNFVFKVPVYLNMPSSRCPNPGDKLARPSLTATKVTDGVVKLSWKEIGGAKGYHLYRKEGENGKYTRIKTISKYTTTSWQDNNATPGKLYYYKVRAYLKLKSGNMYSSFSSVKEMDSRIPAAGWKTFKVSGYTTAQLSWKKKSVTGYQIYRKTDSGKYTRIKTITSRNTTTYKDTTLQPGHTYTYRIRSYQRINGKNYYSSYSSTKKADVKITKPKLKNTVVSQGTAVKLSWQKDSKVNGYEIYRSTDGGKTYKLLKKISKNSTVSYTDKKVSRGKTYYYKIRKWKKVNKKTYRSGYSTKQSVTTG